jgi:hypothetical protein
MGTSKRYADHFDRLMDNRVAAGLMAEHSPASLSNIELELDTEPLTRAPVPRPVTAWVRYGPTALKVDAVAVAWTEFAVAIKWPTPAGEHRAWVWGSAVRARKTPPVPS